MGEMLRETADRLFQMHCDTVTRRMADQGTWPAALWAAVEEAGLHRALVPEEAGGFGVAVADALSLLKGCRCPRRALATGRDDAGKLAAGRRRTGDSRRAADRRASA